jgi:hypothetical protein
MKSIKCIIIGLSLLHQVDAQDHESSRPPSTMGFAIAVLPLKGEEIIDAVYQANDAKLLSSIGRATGVERQIVFPLVWHEQITLDNKHYTVCVFDSPFHLMPGNNPRVLVLMDRDKKIVTWSQFACEPAFRFGSIVQNISDNIPYLVTINPSSRFGGELWFERYKIETSKFTKVGEGVDPRKMNTAQQ